MGTRAERILGIVAEPRNRAVLSILNEAARPVDVAELAERLVDRETTVAESAAYEDDLEAVVISLHHDRLPRLADAGLVEYDRADTVATLRDFATVDAEWMDVGMVDELLAHFRHDSAGADGSIGLIEGRETIIEYGRRLVDVADDELFLLYDSTDLLEDECIHRAEAAIERGVDITLGSTNPEVRDLARRRLPEVTLWEPQVDLTNTPTYPKLGRLVFADRERIMLAILDETEADGHRHERAMIGEGEGNPLVVLARELLGQRLDHLDYQSEEFSNELPFES